MVLTYEGVAEFIHLSTLISDDKSLEKEIQRCILASNRPYFSVINLFRSRLLPTATKILLYTTLIRPEVSYGAVAWTIMKKQQALLIFKGKYLEEYTVLNMKMGNGKVERIRN
jgi:hypothetical protein